MNYAPKGDARDKRTRERCNMGNGTARQMEGSASRDGLDGSRWDGLGNGRLGIARWIERLVMGRARQWMARRHAMNMNWTARDGLDARTGSALDGSACDGPRIFQKSK